MSKNYVLRLSNSWLLFLFTVYTVKGAVILPEAPSYIFSKGSQICSYSENSPNMTSDDVTPNCFWRLSKASSIVLGMVLSKNTLLITEDKTLFQYRLSENKSVHNKMLTYSAGIISAISVDWVSGNIYFADKEESVIRAVNLDGSFAVTIVDKINNVTGLAVDPIGRFIFWTSPEYTNAIGKSSLDGSKRNDNFYWRNQSQPFYLTMDHHEKRLYWTDNTLASIESISVTGENHRIIMAGNNNYPYTLAVNKDHIIWSENVPLNVLLNLNGIYWTLKSGGGHANFDHHLSFYNVKDLIFFSEYAQPQDYNNSCSDQGSDKCSQLCFPTSKTERKCVCSLGYKLDSDGKTCNIVFDSSSYNENTIFIADSGRGTMFAMNTITKEISAIPLERETDLGHIIVDSKSNMLIYTNYVKGNIHSVMLNHIQTSSVKTVLNFKSAEYGRHTVITLAAIPDENLLVYSDLTLGKIDSISYDGTSKHNITLNINNTWSIVADNRLRQLYLAVWGDSSGPSKILRVAYDGSSRTTLVNTMINQPRGLCVDFEGNMMYWVDTSTIERATTLGLNRKHMRYKIGFIGSNRVFFDVAISGDYLYIADWGDNNQLKRIQRHTFSRIERFGPREFLHTTGIFAYSNYMVTTTTSTTTSSTINVEKHQQDVSTTSTTITIAATVAVVVVFLVIAAVVLAFVCLRKKPLPASQTPDDNAFENPVYASTADLPPMYQADMTQAQAAAPPVNSGTVNDKEQLKLHLGEQFGAT